MCGLQPVHPAENSNYLDGTHGLKYAASQLNLQVRPSGVAGNKRARHLPRHEQGALNTRAARRIPRRAQKAKSALQNRLLPRPSLVRGWTREPAAGWARRGALHLNDPPCTFSVLNSRCSCPDAELSPPPGYPDNAAKRGYNAQVKQFRGSGDTEGSTGTDTAEWMRFSSDIHEELLYVLY